MQSQPGCFLNFLSTSAEFSLPSWRPPGWSSKSDAKVGFLTRYSLRLAAAAMEAERSENPDDDAEDVNDVIGDDEAAEILEAMLGLAPAALAAEPQKKKRRANWKVRSIAEFALVLCYSLSAQADLNR
jgi:uncharacterized protein YcbX